MVHESHRAHAFEPWSTAVTTKRKLPKERLSRAEVEALIDASSRRAPTGIRNRALLATLYWSMIRCQEALDLYPRDITPPTEGREALVDVKCGKGAKQRQVPLSRDGWAYLELWLAERKRLGIDASKPLFCQITKGREGRPLQGAYVRHLFPRLATRAGVDKRCHAHGLRYSAATNARDQGVPESILMNWLGHTSLQTTAIYLATATSAELSAIAARVTF